MLKSIFVSILDADILLQVSDSEARVILASIRHFYIVDPPAIRQFQSVNISLFGQSISTSKHDTTATPFAGPVFGAAASGCQLLPGSLIVI